MTSLELDGDTSGTALVVGATSGIGRAVAKTLNSMGYRVVAASRHNSSVHEVPGATTPLPVDVRSYSSCKKLGEQLVSSPPNVIVNSAGVGYFAPLGKDYSKQWRDILETNVLGLMNLASMLLEHNLEPQHFVQIGSLASHRLSQTQGNALYSATKTAGAVLIEHFRRVLQDRGSSTAVSLLSPGFVEGTRFEDTFFAHEPSARRPLYGAGGNLTPLDVADAVAYIVARPAHVRIDEILVRPSVQQR